MNIKKNKIVLGSQKKLRKGLFSTAIVVAMFCGYLENTVAKLTPAVRAALAPLVDIPLLSVPQLTAAQECSANILLANALAMAAIRTIVCIGNAGGDSRGGGANIVIVNAAFGAFGGGGLIAAPVAGIIGGIAAGGGAAPAPAAANATARLVSEISNAMNIAAGVGPPVWVAPVAWGVLGENGVNQAISAAARLIVGAGKCAEKSAAAGVAAVAVGAGVPALSPAATRAMNTYRVLSARGDNIENLNNPQNARLVIRTFLQLTGIVPAESGIAIAGPPAVNMEREESPANHLWEHLLERGHLWNDSPHAVAVNNTDLSYLAWSCAARINDHQVPTTGGFIVAAGAFANTYLNILNVIAGAAIANIDISWGGTVDGCQVQIPGGGGAAAPVGGGAAIQPTENIARLNNVSLHVAPGAAPNILKARLGNGGGTSKIEASTVRDEAELTLKISHQIIADESNITEGPWIKDKEVHWNTNGVWLANAFLPTLAAGGIAAPAAGGAAAGSILLGVGSNGAVTTMFGE
ncbi:MAG: hypothetical protein LBT67_00140 [Holosporaceae bacterium]|jgi:hypothetical protein|nr:hypothetical protein [Holosporaceae bacterium]